MVDLSSQSGRSIKFKLYSFTHTFFNQVPVFCLFRSLYFLFAFSLIFTLNHLIIAASNVRMFLVRTSFFEPGVVKRQTTLNTEFALAFVCFLVRKISFVILRFLEIEMFLSFVRAVAIFSISFIRDGFERVQKKQGKQTYKYSVASAYVKLGSDENYVNASLLTSCLFVVSVPL